jgi:hypothetical protein
MTKHCKIYMDYFGYGIDDFIPCEVNGEKAVDIHHIHGRGKGMDVIENLMALCRKHHDAAKGIGGTYLHPDMMQIIHNNFLKRKT